MWGIGLFLKKNKVRFGISMAAAAAADLKIGAQLLNLAGVVIPVHYK